MFFINQFCSTLSLGVQSGNLYYRSGLFVPDKSDLFFSVYDTMTGLSQRIIRKQLTVTTNDRQQKSSSWENLNDQMIDGKFVIGMFNFVPKHRSFGLTDNMEILEFIWTNFDEQNPHDEIRFIPKVIDFFFFEKKL